MSEFLLEILTPAAPAFRGQVSMVVAPGQDGYFGVLRGHLPLVAALQKGRVKARESGGDREWTCGSGVACVEPDRVTLLVESLAAVAVPGGSDQPAPSAT